MYVCIIPFYVLLCIKTRIKISFVYTTVNYLKFNNKYTNHRGQLFTAMLINIDLLIQELSFTIVINYFCHVIKIFDSKNTYIIKTYIINNYTIGYSLSYENININLLESFEKIIF